MNQEVPEVYADCMAWLLKWLYAVPKPLDTKGRIAWSKGAHDDLLKLKDKYDAKRKANDH